MNNEFIARFILDVILNEAKDLISTIDTTVFF